LRWEDTKTQWHDSVSRDFEAQFLQELEPEVIQSLERLSNLAQVLTAAQQECSEHREIF